MPSLVTSVIAASPSRVAGILMYRLPRSAVARSRRHAGGGGGVAAQPRVDLDGHAPVEPGRPGVHRRQDVTGGPDVVGRHRENGGAGVGAFVGQVSELVVVPVALGQGGGEDRRAGGDPNDVPGGDERLQAAAGQQLAGQVIEPRGHAGGGQVAQRVMLGLVTHASLQAAGGQFSDQWPYFAAVLPGQSRRRRSAAGSACWPACRGGSLSARRLAGHHGNSRFRALSLRR
jgi:hypothetical protein